MTVWASSVWPINGCTFGRDRNFYASQLFTNSNWTYGEVPDGEVVKILFNNPAAHTVLTGGALSFTGGVAVACPNPAQVFSGHAVESVKALGVIAGSA